MATTTLDKRISLVTRVRTLLRGLFPLSLALLLGAMSSLAVALPPPNTDVPEGSPAAPPAPGAPKPVSTNTIFDDAVTLKGWIAAAPAHDAEIKAMLKAYNVDPSLTGNPFLQNVAYLKTLGTKRVAPAQITPNAIANASSMSGLSAGSVADALGTLIAERVKQDAELTALRELSRAMKKIDRDSQAAAAGKPLTAAFPKTMAYLGTLDSESIDSNDWTILQSDFKSDIAAFPQNLPNFLDSLYNQRTNTETRFLTFVAASTGVQVIKNGRHPYDVIDSVQAASTTFLKAYAPPIASSGTDPVTDIARSLEFVEILSHMLTQDRQSTWHSSADVRRLVDSADGTTIDPDGLNLLLGLSYATDTALYADVKGWLAANGKPSLISTDLSTTLGNGLPQIADLLVKIHQDVASIPNPMTNIADAAPLVGDLSSLGTALCDNVLIGVAPSSSLTTAKVRILDVSGKLGIVVSITGDIRAGQYAAAIGEIVTFLQLYPDSISQNPTLTVFFKNNGPFITAVAGAKTSEDVKTAFETYALPANSYTQIQQTPFSVTLNSYFGVTAGASTALGNLEGTGTARTRAHVGFAAPVGLDFNFGMVKNPTVSGGNVADATPSTRFFQTGSWSVFLPILDVGAVASWRLGSGGGQIPAITWSNIVAPGLFVVWTKKDTPLSILFGAQYGPELTKISASGGTTIEKATLQFPAIEFTFDIPIFSLYQTPAPTIKLNANSH